MLISSICPTYRKGRPVAGEKKKRVLSPGVQPSRTASPLGLPRNLRSALKSCAGPDNPAPPAIRILRPMSPKA
jgi:hypothetical protein